MSSAMKLLLIFAVACYASTAFGEEVGKSKWSFVFTSLAKSSTGDNEEEANNALVNAIGGVFMTCEPGWTGESCKYPICQTRGTVTAPNLDIFGRLVDSVSLPNCVGTLLFPYDSLSVYSYVAVTSDGGSPRIVFTDFNGVIIETTEGINDATHHQAFYRNIPPGQYNVTIRLTQGPATYCMIETRASSNVSWRGALVASLQSDIPVNDGLYGIDNVPSYFVAHPFELPFPGGLSAVTIVKDGTFNYRAPLGARYACAYEYFAGAFTCNAGSTYIAKVDGVDYNGYPLRRAAVFGCILGTTTIAPITTTPPPLTQCRNGGTIVLNGTPDAYCFCPVLYTGRSCEQPLCMNGGTSNAAGDACFCEPGFGGANCQDVNCTISQDLGFLTDYKTLVVVVRSSTSMTANLATIRQALQTVMTAFNTAQMDVYRSFLLVSFVNETLLTQYFGPNDFARFIAAFDNLATRTSPGGCTDKVMGAVSAAFDNIILNKSPMFVFSDAYADDYSDTFFTILNKNANRKLPIHFFTITPTAASGCDTPSVHPAVAEMEGLAAYTQGLSMRVDPGVNLGNLVQSIVFGVTHKMNYLLMNDLINCLRQPDYQTFFVDSNTTTIHFLATGVNMQLTVIAPNGDTFSPPLQFQINNTYAWHMPNPAIGQYLLQVGGANVPCSYRVLARGEYSLFYASSPGLIVDEGYGEPVYDAGRHIVATFNRLTVTDPFRQFAEITIYGNGLDDKRQGLYMSNGVYRDGCNYKMYFGAYNCRQRNQRLYITVYADDYAGNTIQRSAVGFCASFDTTPAPPGSCLNGGVGNPTNTTKCLCPPQFTGDFCQNIICQNGGTATAGICTCPPGTRGQFCEINTCHTTATGVQFDPNRRSLIFVLSVRASMQPVLTDMANNIGEAVRDMQIGSPNWITNFMVIVFNETTVMVLKNNSDPQSFVSGIGAAATYPAMADPNWPSANCTVKLQSALLLALDNSFMNSYIFLFTDSNSQDELLSLNILSGAERTLAMINVITTTSPICGASASVSGIMPAIEQNVAFSGGDFYNTNDLGNFVKFVPTFYESGLTYINYKANCSTENMTIYFPIDGWTQSFTTAIYGNFPSVTIVRPDGRPTTQTPLDVPLINPNPTTPNLLLRQTIIPCDDFRWYNQQQYCYMFEFNQRTWNESRDYCHDPQRGALAFMADVHSNATQNFLDFQTNQQDYWIGLNCLATLGQWEWDVPNGAAYSHLDPNGYLNWDTAAGEPANDPNKRCVQVRHSGSNQGKWYATDCSIRTVPVCQKHRYGQGIFPGEQGTNLLPQGMWRADISATSGFCYVQVRSQSRIQPYYGFVQDIHSDQAEFFGLFNSQSNRLAVTVTGLNEIGANSPTGSLNYAFMYKTNYTMNRAVTFEQRDLCAYRYISQTFSCPGQVTPNTIIDDFFIKFSGIDQFGNLFERFTPAYCLSQVILPCANGATFYQGTCICPPFFTGTLCSSRLCQNGGVQSANGRTCNCPSAFTGDNCEFAMCLPPYPANFHNNGKTLAIVLETSYSTGATVFRLQRNLDTLLNQVLNGSTSDWFSNFILYPFDSVDNMDSWYAPNVSTTVAGLKAALAAFPPGRCPGSGCADPCPRPIMRALNATLDFPQLTVPGSQVLVITQSGAEDYALADQVMAKIQSTGAVVTVLIADRQSPCSQGFNVSEGRALVNVAFFSGGSVFLLTSYEVGGVFITSYLPTLYSAAIISGGFAQVCTGQVTYVQVDGNMTDFALDIFGLNVVVSVTGPTGPIRLPPSLLVSSFNYFQVVGPDLLQGGGIYTVNVSAAGSECGTQVRGSSSIEAFIGYTQVTDSYNGATQDDAHFAPLAGGGQQNVVLVHMRGMMRGGYMSYVEIVGTTGVVFTSPLARRSSNCSYQYYSTRSFICNSRTFLIAVHGWDDFGVNFRRLAIGHCIDTRPRPPPPPPFCNLKQKKIDMVFVLDASLAMNNESFQTVKTFVKTMMIAYNVSQSAAQIGMLTLAQTPQRQFILSDSNSMSVPNLVDPVPYDGTDGQNVTGALNMLATTLGSLNNGYRGDNTTQHLVIYITRNAIFTGGDPYTLATAMRRSGQWGIATLAYGILQGNSNNLVELSSGERCFYHVGNVVDLNTLGLNFLQTLTCFDGHLCQ